MRERAVVLDTRDALEDAAALAERREIRDRKRPQRVVARGLFMDEHDALLSMNRERLEQDSVRDAEHRRVGADGERERQHRHRREAGALAQGAQGVAEVLDVRYPSARRAITASMRVLDRAGIRLASAATPMRNPVTAVSVAGSVGVTP